MYNPRQILSDLSPYFISDTYSIQPNYRDFGIYLGKNEEGFRLLAERSFLTNAYSLDNQVGNILELFGRRTFVNRRESEVRELARMRRVRYGDTLSRNISAYLIPPVGLVYSMSGLSARHGERMKLLEDVYFSGRRNVTSEVSNRGGDGDFLSYGLTYRESDRIFDSLKRDMNTYGYLPREARELYQSADRSGYFKVWSGNPEEVYKKKQKELLESSQILMKDLLMTANEAGQLQGIMEQYRVKDKVMFTAEYRNIQRKLGIGFESILQGSSVLARSYQSHGYFPDDAMTGALSSMSSISNTKLPLAKIIEFKMQSVNDLLANPYFLLSMYQYDESTGSLSIDHNWLEKIKSGKVGMTPADNKKFNFVDQARKNVRSIPAKYHNAIFDKNSLAKAGLDIKSLEQAARMVSFNNVLYSYRISTGDDRPLSDFSPQEFSNIMVLAGINPEIFMAADDMSTSGYEDVSGLYSDAWLSARFDKTEGFDFNRMKSYSYLKDSLDYGDYIQQTLSPLYSDAEKGDRMEMIFAAMTELDESYKYNESMGKNMFGEVLRLHEISQNNKALPSLSKAEALFLYLSRQRDVALEKSPGLFSSVFGLYARKQNNITQDMYRDLIEYAFSEGGMDRNEYAQLLGAVGAMKLSGNVGLKQHFDEIIGAKKGDETLSVYSSLAFTDYLTTGEVSNDLESKFAEVFPDDPKKLNEALKGLKNLSEGDRNSVLSIYGHRVGRLSRMEESIDRLMEAYHTPSGKIIIDKNIEEIKARNTPRSIGSGTVVSRLSVPYAGKYSMMFSKYLLPILYNLFPSLEEYHGERLNELLELHHSGDAIDFVVKGRSNSDVAFVIRDSGLMFTEVIIEATADGDEWIHCGYDGSKNGHQTFCKMKALRSGGYEILPISLF